MSRIISLVAAAIIIAGSLAIADFLISQAPEPTRTEPPPQIPFAQTGRVTAESGSIPVYGAGTVRPSAEIDIAPQVGGKIVWVEPGFQSSGRVKAGQTIFRIEEADYLHQVQEAEANIVTRRMALLEEQEKAEFARTQYELYSAGQENSDATSAASPFMLREPQVKAALAALKRDEIRLAAVNLALSRTVVVAPFDGFVREESLEVGQIVSPGQTVARLFASDAVEVVVSLSDSNAALIPGLWKLEAGDGNTRIAARVAAQYGNRSYVWKGYVDRAEAFLDPQTRTVDVIVRVPDPFSASTPTRRSAGGAPPLLVGEFVEVQIAGLAMKGYFKTPRASLQSNNEVWVVKDGAVNIVPVQVLQRADNAVLVTGSLEDNLAVIVGGIQFATEGMPVRTGTDESP